MQNDTLNIVIVGGGAGGLELAVGLSKKYRKSNIQVTLVDREKTHMWKPHLHEVAAGILDSHAEQVAYLNVASRFGFNFVWGNMQALDKEKKSITLAPMLNAQGIELLPARELAYDYLVMAVGSTSNDFGTPGVKDFAFSLDDLVSANAFHQTMLEKVLQKEFRAEHEEHFRISIIGGGATGVELAAALTETTKKLSQFGLKKLKEKPVQITVVNAADQLLPGLSEKISRGALDILSKAGVTVLNSTKVIEVQDGTTVVERGGERYNIHSDMIVWAAGVKSPEFLTHFGLETTRGNQIVVNGQLQSTDKHIFVIGDCASVKWINAPKEGMMVPPRAQSAHQMSEYLIEHMRDITEGKDVPDFVYRDFGSLISLGEVESVGTLMGFLQGRSLFVEGKIAKAMYIHLYQHHQIKINGFIAAVGLFIGKMIQKRFKPTVKVH